MVNCLPLSPVVQVRHSQSCFDHQPKGFCSPVPGADGESQALVSRRGKRMVRSWIMGARWFECFITADSTGNPASPVLPSWASFLFSTLDGLCYLPMDSAKAD